MPKQFITERDIEDMARRGEMQLAVDDDTVLTDLAYEKAQRLGVTLLRPNLQPPAAPVRPYLSTNLAPVRQEPVVFTQPSITHNLPQNHGGNPPTGELKKRVIEAVTNRLNGQVDPSLLATIVERVFADLGVR